MALKNILSGVTVALLILTVWILNPRIPETYGAPPVGWVDDGTIVRLETNADLVGIGTTTPQSKLHVIGDLAISGLIDGIDISVKAPDWDTAFMDRLKWDGGSQSLNATTGRASLGLGALATLNAVSGGAGGAITDKTVATADLDNLDHIILKDTDGLNCHKLTVNSLGTLSTLAVNCATGDPLGPAVADNFESYATGSLNGANGGNGWTNAWTASGVNVADDQAYEGTKSAKIPTGTNSAERPHNNVSTNPSIVSFRFRKDNTSNPESHITVWEGSAIRSRIQIANDSNVYLVPNLPTGTLIGSFTANAWHFVEMEINFINDQVRARLNGGAWTNFQSVSGGGDMQAINKFRMEHIDSVSGNTWFDDIKIN